ncbi:DUF1684 domain-containing protein [Agromyces salentinus]|uniref:DUF1684 domain-containing protein n=1 Tax=Agromyces salentinus TaxID=269421 RepID=A0ABN2MTA9_9MICO|nr:DUF1684 domain-containing protein [Agromyces salentinus]
MTIIEAGATEREQSEFTREWERWHRAHETRRADPHGFLAVTGITWLTTIPARIDGVPGAWSTSEAGPVVELAEGEQLRDGDDLLTGRHAFGPIAERSSVVVHAGGIAVEVARRGGQDLVRPRDPGHPYLARFSGTPAYEPTADWVVPGRYVAYDVPREVTVGSAAEGLQHVYESPGEVEFERDGATHRLVAFNGAGPGQLHVLFTDATSGVTTYAANRSLDIDAPAADGSVLLDFTRAVNLPCAYTDHATCPLPPAGNRLSIAVEAGEKAPLERELG